MATDNTLWNDESLTDKIIWIISMHTSFSHEELKDVYIGSFDDLIDTIEYSKKENIILSDAYTLVLASKD